MTAISVKPVRIDEKGSTVVEAFIVSDAIPSPLPTTGENVHGMSKK